MGYPKAEIVCIHLPWGIDHRPSVRFVLRLGGKDIRSVVVPIMPYRTGSSYREDLQPGVDRVISGLGMPNDFYLTGHWHRQDDNPFSDVWVRDADAVPSVAP